MALITNLDELYCLAFPRSFKDPTNQWFHSLKLRSISGFNQLSKRFISQFIDIHEQPKHDTQLLTVRQKKGEFLKKFVDRFNRKKLKVYDLDETIAITAFYLGVQNIKCAVSFPKD